MKNLYNHKVELSSQSASTSRLLTNLLKLKLLDHIGFIKLWTIVGVLKWADVLGRAVLTNGSWKMWDTLTFSIVALSKEILQLFLSDVFLLIRGCGWSILESIMSKKN